MHFWVTAGRGQEFPSLPARLHFCGIKRVGECPCDREEVFISADGGVNGAIH